MTQKTRVMADLKGLPEPCCTEMPICRCGEEMAMQRAYSVPRKTDTHVRVYKCVTCDHEMRLTVWGADDLVQVA